MCVCVCGCWGGGGGLANAVCSTAKVFTSGKLGIKFTVNPCGKTVLVTEFILKKMFLNAPLTPEVNLQLIIT